MDPKNISYRIIWIDKKYMPYRVGIWCSKMSVQAVWQGDDSSWSPLQTWWAHDTQVL